MLNFKNWSLKVKVVGIGILLPSLLIAGLFIMYYIQSKDRAVEKYVEKARSGTLRLSRSIGCSLSSSIRKVGEPVSNQ